MKIRFVSEQFSVGAKNCESYGLWSSGRKQPCVLCLRCMLGAVPTTKLHQYVINDLDCRDTLFTSNKKEEEEDETEERLSRKHLSSSKNVLFYIN